MRFPTSPYSPKCCFVVLWLSPFEVLRACVLGFGRLRFKKPRTPKAARFRAATDYLVRINQTSTTTARASPSTWMSPVLIAKHCGIISHDESRCLGILNSSSK